MQWEVVTETWVVGMWRKHAHNMSEHFQTGIRTKVCLELHFIGVTLLQIPQVESSLFTDSCFVWLCYCSDCTNNTQQ